MVKGFFTQGIAIMLSEPVSLDAIRKCLAAQYTVVRESPNANNWVFGGPSLTVEFKPEVNGYVLVDITDRPWPDHMGDPRTEPELMGAWSMGYFGPYAYPNGLSRAISQAWHWSAAAAAVSRHTAFVRIKISYVLGAGDDAAVRPTPYDPVEEMDFITGMGRALLALPEALALFNPNGELLMPADQLDSMQEYNRQNALPGLDAWINVRMFNFDAAWLVMDTVGNWQIDLPDHEAAFPKEQFEASEVANFLRNTSLYLLRNGEVIKDGDTMDGPGGVRWQGCSFGNGVSDPPRRILRWIPYDAQNIPAALSSQVGATSPQKRWRRKHLDR